MKIKELRQKNTVELSRLVGEKVSKIQELRFGLAAGKIKNVRELREARRDIARAKTLLAEESAKAKE